MFVRFRQSTHRLQLSLVETRRLAGKVRHEHVASLGAIVTPTSVADRIAFWEQLNERLARLSNRIDAETQGKLLSVVHERIPMPTLDDRRTLQIEDAEAAERFWSGVQEAQEDYSAGHKEVAALSERKASEAKAEANKAAAQAAGLRDRIARLKKGEDVSGGTGKRLSRKEMIAIIGGKAAAKRAARVAAIFDAGAEEEMFKEQHKRAERVENAVINSVYRQRVLRNQRSRG
jgi:hypothetical protein